jgi:hypothetical protein
MRLERAGKFFLDNIDVSPIPHPKKISTSERLWLYLYPCLTEILQQKGFLALLSNPAKLG